MKISRVKSNTVVKASDDMQVTEAVKLPCKYDTAIDCVKCAIDELSRIAKDDVVAKESIVNLSVVLMDLKGSC